MQDENGDGLTTNLPNLTIGVTVADCVPVLLFDPVSGAIAALHAGRAGTTLNIAAAGVQAMVAAYGTQPGDLHAAVGPSAGPCCYEVSETMAAECAAAGVAARGRHLDLWTTNQQQLEAAGLKTAHIAVSGRCTICTPQFHSYRRDKSRARNLAIISL